MSHSASVQAFGDTIHASRPITTIKTQSSVTSPDPLPTPTRAHLNKTFESLSKKYTAIPTPGTLANVLEKIPKQEKPTNDTPSSLSRNEPDRERNFDVEANIIVELDAEWGGPGWLPQELYRRRSSGKAICRGILDITHMAKELGIPLHSLWEKGGLLRDAYDPSDHSPNSIMKAISSVNEELGRKIHLAKQGQTITERSTLRSPSANKQINGLDASKTSPSSLQFSQIRQPKRLNGIFQPKPNSHQPVSNPPKDAFRLQSQLLKGTHITPSTHASTVESRFEVIPSPSSPRRVVSTVSSAASPRSSTQMQQDGVKDRTKAAPVNGTLPTPKSPSILQSVRSAQHNQRQDLTPQSASTRSQSTSQASQVAAAIRRDDSDPSLAKPTSSPVTTSRPLPSIVAAESQTPKESIDHLESQEAAAAAAFSTMPIALDSTSSLSSDSLSPPPSEDESTPPKFNDSDDPAYQSLDSSPVLKKRKREPPVDGNGVSPGNNPPKRNRYTVQPDVEKVYRQLTDKIELTDDVILFVAEVLVAEYGSKKARLLDPLWFNANESERLPQAIASLNLQEVVYYFAIHHARSSHWSLGVLSGDGSSVRCNLYDSMQNVAHRGIVQDRLQRWLVEIGETRPLLFTSKICPQQDDEVSCGVFVLAFLKHLVQGSAIPSSLTASEERQSLLSELRRADRANLDIHQLAVIDGLRKGKTKTTEGTGTGAGTVAKVDHVAAVGPSIEADIVDLVEYPDDGLSLIGRTDIAVIQERLKAAKARVVRATETYERAKAAVEAVKYTSEAMDIVNGEFIPDCMTALREEIPIPPEFADNRDSGIGQDNVELAGTSRLNQNFRSRSAVFIQMLQQGYLDTAKFMRNYIADAAKDHVEDVTRDAEARLSRAAREKTDAEAATWKLEMVLLVKDGWNKVAGEDIGQLLAGGAVGSAPKLLDAE